MNDNPNDETLEIKDFGAREKFRNLAISLGLDPDDPWVDGYVSYEWGKVRHIIEELITVKNQRVLEFGCHIGATAIVVALLGHNVVGVDIEKHNIEMSQLNATQYGVSQNTDFIHVKSAEKLNYDDGYFDLIICNSVLEYVNDNDIDAEMKELDRLLRPGGIMIITGTSSRLSPKEVHRGQWFINYVPEYLGKMIWGPDKYQRGLNPFRIMKHLKHYKNLDLENDGQLYFRVREKFGLSEKTLSILRCLKNIFHPVGISVGLLTPSFSVNLRKPD